MGSVLRDHRAGAVRGDHPCERSGPQGRRRRATAVGICVGGLDPVARLWRPRGRGPGRIRCRTPLPSSALEVVAMSQPDDLFNLKVHVHCQCGAVRKFCVPTDQQMPEPLRCPPDLRGAVEVAATSAVPTAIRAVSAFQNSGIEPSPSWASARGTYSQRRRDYRVLSRGNNRHQYHGWRTPSSPRASARNSSGRPHRSKEPVDLMGREEDRPRGETALKAALSPVPVVGGPLATVFGDEMDRRRERDVNRYRCHPVRGCR